ncbi:polysaccharide deacetylase family protein [Candidatus Uhrbacteria bacterium]|nr:polysaccharide deacetylase family protein [Candidatus Uhrbacteria bacterium]
MSHNSLFSFQNHSYDESGFTPHCYWLTHLKTDKQKTDQINLTQDILTRLTGKAPTMFRFPGLCRSATDDKLVENLGYIINNGSVIASDPFNHSLEKIISNVLTRAKDGGVIVMHIGGPNARESYDALIKIIPELEARGYVFGKL